MAQDWLWMSAGDLGRAIGDGNIDPVALTGPILDAIRTHPLSDRIYARLTGDGAGRGQGRRPARARRQPPRAARRRAGELERPVRHRRHRHRGRFRVAQGPGA